MLSDRCVCLDVARQALAACNGPIGPDVPPASQALLQRLVSALDSYQPLPVLLRVLQACADDEHVWLALRLADHRGAVEVSAAYSPDAAGSVS